MSIVVVSLPSCVSCVGPVSASLNSPLNAGEPGRKERVLLACLLVFFVGEVEVAAAFALFPFPPGILEVGLEDERTNELEQS